MAAKKVISAKISKESADGWRDFCHVNGVSLTALIEVAGLQLAQETNPKQKEGKRFPRRGLNPDPLGEGQVS